MKIKELLKNRVILYSIVLYGVFMAVLFVASLAEISGLPEEFPALNFELDDVFGGGAVSYAGHGGNPVIIYFFASW